MNHPSRKNVALQLRNVKLISSSQDGAEVGRGGGLRNENGAGDDH